MRPKQPKITDHNDPECYLSLIQYYNKTEKMFDTLERMLPKLEEWAHPYTGEYDGGQMDLICDILSRERIDWSIDFDALRVVTKPCKRRET